MSLLRAVAPYDDESGLGYYRRLAAENRFWGWRDLAGLANIARQRRALLEHPEQVAKELGIESAWTQSAARQEQQCRAWRARHRVSSDAICPACLSESVYIRHYWEHTYVTACAVHRTCLLDHCPACAVLLSPNRVRIERCACGYDLRTSKAPAATVAQYWLSTLIASDGSSSGGTQPKLHVVDVSAACELVRILCLQFNPLVSQPSKGAANVRTVQEAVEFLKPLEQLLADWPHAFERHVAERIAAGNPEARTLNTLLGQWYLQLKKICQGNSLEPILRVVIAVAAKDFDGALGLDTAKDIAAEVTEYVRIADAAKAIGVSRDRLLKAASAGECAFRPRRFGTRGVVYEVPTSEVKRIQQRRTEWVSDALACDIAQVPKSVLHHMVAAKVIVGDPNWRHDILKGGPIEEQSLRSLFNNLNRQAKPRSPNDAEWLTWAELTSRRMGDKQAIQSVMKAIAAGHVVAVVRGHHLGQMGFLRADIAEYFGTPVLESGLSIQQLAKFTGWKWESIAHWISLGLLESQQIILRGQQCRVVLPQHLLLFRQTYVPLADLARAMGTKSSSLSRQLTGLEIIGAKVLPNGLKRGGLIRVADLGRLAVLGARATNSLANCVEANSVASAAAVDLVNYEARALPARQALVSEGKLVSVARVCEGLNLTRQAISKALASGRIFTVDVEGTQYYPVFFLASDIDRKTLGRVTRLLGALPGWSKWQFFKTSKASLDNLTPLEALLRGKIQQVEQAARTFAES